MPRTTALLLAAALALPAWSADEAAPASPKKEDLASILKGYSADMSIPDTPGLAIVGLSSENVIRPTTPRKLGMAILQGRNDSGTAKQGFAIDLAPLKVLNPRMSKQEYNDSPFVGRPLWNTQVSLGVGQPLSDTDKSTRIGLGLSSTLWRKERADPLLNENHAGCLTRALRDALPEGPEGLDTDKGGATAPPAAATPAGTAASGTAGTQPKTTEKKNGEKEVAKKTLKQCYFELEAATWNASALMIGLATSTISGRDPAVLPDGSPKGFWISLNYGFESMPSLQKVLQFTASYRRLREEIVVDPSDKTRLVSQNGHLVGAKLYGRMEVGNLFVEASRARSTIAGRETERANLFVFGVERKITDNVWLTLAMGSKRGGTATNPTYVTTGLKFGSEESVSIKP